MTPDDANSNTITLPTTKINGITISAPENTITNVNPLAQTPVNTGRTTQQQILPAVVKLPALSNQLQVVKSTPGSIYLPDQTSAHFIFTLNSDQDNFLMAVPSVSFFIGGDKDHGDHWPTPTLGEGLMPTSVFNDDYFSDGNDVVTQAIIRNNSGLTQLVWCYCNWRLVFNLGGINPVLTTVPPLPVGGRGGL